MAHVWLVMLKPMRAVTRYAAAGIEGTGLGDSDFRVLEVLLHKGPLPINTIGPHCFSLSKAFRADEESVLGGIARYID